MELIQNLSVQICRDKNMIMLYDSGYEFDQLIKFYSNKQHDFFG